MVNEMEQETRHSFIENGNFIVFEDGRIFKRLDPPVSSSGYKFVRIGKKSYPLQRVIASTFIPNPDNKPEVNHIDGDKTNNAVSNLEWVTKSENIQHAVRIGLRSSRKVLRQQTLDDNQKNGSLKSMPVNQNENNDSVTFAQRTKIALIERNMTQTELCNAVTERTGLYCDHSLLHRIFSGQLPGAKVKEAICNILGIAVNKVV